MPATGAVTPKSVATSGRSPMMTNSVVPMPNAAAAKASRGRFMFSVRGVGTPNLRANPDYRGVTGSHLQLGATPDMRGNAPPRRAAEVEQLKVTYACRARATGFV